MRQLTTRNKCVNNCLSEACPGLPQTSGMGKVATVVNSLKPLTFVAKRSIINA